MTQLALPLSVLAQKREWIQRAYWRVCDLRLGLPDEFSADHLREITGDPPVPNWFSCVVAMLVTDGWIVEKGRVTSTRRSANGRKVGLYGWRNDP